MIGGLAAAGKTTLGREIARITKFAFLDKDTMTLPLVEALLSATHAPGGTDDRQSDVYLNRVRPLEYECFLNTAIENVALGVSTIAVAPFLSEMADPLWLRSLHKQLPAATIHKIWIDASDAELHKRIVARGSARDRHKLDNWTDHISACRKVRPCDSCLLIEPYPNEDPAALAMRTLRTLGIPS